MIDASHIKVHPHAARSKRENQSLARTKGGVNAKLHWLLMPTDAGQNDHYRWHYADCIRAEALIDSFLATCLVTDEA